MSISPGTYNITLQRRADWSALLQFTDSNSQAIDLGGYSLAAQAWDAVGRKKFADFSVTYTDRTAGKVTIALSDEQTALFPESLAYDVALTDPNGLKHYYLQGTITTEIGLTQ